MQESNQVVRDGGSFQTPTIRWVKEWLDYGEEPVTQESFIDFTEEGGAGYVP